MSLEINVNNEIKQAMLAKNEARLRALRAIKSAILLEKTSGAGAALSQDTEMKMLQKLAKQRKDSLEIFEKQNREDLAVKEREELEVIASFLPAQMNSEELNQYLTGLIRELGVQSASEMGKIMGRASKELAGKADGKAISTALKTLLA